MWDARQATALALVNSRATILCTSIRIGLMSSEVEDQDDYRRDAQKLLNEGWEPYGPIVGALCRKGTNWPATHVAPHLWEAMRAILDEAKNG
jgi:hypothetical protein